MNALDLLVRGGRGAAGIPPHPAAAQAWTRAEVEAARGTVFLDVGDAVRGEIADAVAQIRANGLDGATMEQEDFRLPGFAPVAARMRAQLDAGFGLQVLRGLPVSLADEPASEIVAWGLANYLGRPIRQSLTRDRRLFTVTDKGGENGDPTRLGATNQTSRMHTDNGCLEPRPPCYLGLLCVSAARAGGNSTVISAAALHNAYLAERPDLLPLLFEPFHFLPPRLQTWPQGPRTVVKPIFERAGEAMHVHYARVMVEPGMELAGTPLTPRQREALDVLDALLERDDLVFDFRLEDGDFLFANNLSTLHGRLAYTDDAPATDARRRCLKRVWMWRRHVGPGVDPVALDLAELH